MNTTTSSKLVYCTSCQAHQTAESMEGVHEHIFHCNSCFNPVDYVKYTIEELQDKFTVDEIKNTIANITKQIDELSEKANKLLHYKYQLQTMIGDEHVQ